MIDRKTNEPGATAIATLALTPEHPSKEATPILTCREDILPPGLTLGVKE